MVTNSPEYMREYAAKNYMKYYGTKKAKLERASRNKARKIAHTPKGKQVDHINKNPMDDAPKNLRNVSQLFNERHKKKK